jgi:N-methylhydantoinase B
VLEDVIDDYVSIERAAKDYGVVIKAIDPEICAYQIDEAATGSAREKIRGERGGWLATDPEEVAAGYRAGNIDTLDVVRRYAVVLDWDSGALLPKSTGQFREMFHKRTAAAWARSAVAKTPASSGV